MERPGQPSAQIQSKFEWGGGGPLGGRSEGVMQSPMRHKTEMYPSLMRHETLRNTCVRQFLEERLMQSYGKLLVSSQNALCSAVRALCGFMAGCV